MENKACINHIEIKIPSRVKIWFVCLARISHQGVGKGLPVVA